MPVILGDILGLRPGVRRMTSVQLNSVSFSEPLIIARMQLARTAPAAARRPWAA